jgi:hypothetical protein
MKIRTQLLLSLIFLILISCNTPSGNKKPGSQSQSEVDTTTQTNTKIPDYTILAGDWLRADGGKTIRIKSILPGGQLDAEYLNPKPIHVGRAEWMVKNNSLVVIIELQDVNYPGSRYALEYFPAEDVLAGVYYQAVDKVNFEVEFVRQR